MNIASVSWRCGQSCAWVAAGNSRSRVAMPARTAGVSTAVSSGCRASAADDHLAGLGEVRRAGDIGEEPVRGQCPDAASSSSDWSATSSRTSSGRLRQRASGRRRSAPRPVQGASSRIRSKRRRSVAEPPTVADDHLRCRIEDRESPLHQPGTGGDQLVRDEGGPAERRLGGEQRRLAAGTGAEVEPALPRPDRSRPRERQGGELRAFVLDSCAARGDLGDTGGIPARRAGGDRRDRAGLPHIHWVAQAGKGHQADTRRDVVGVEELFELPLATLGGQRVPEGGDDPDRVRVLGREALVARETLQYALAPLLGARPGDRAQDTVDESGGRGRPDRRGPA